MAFEIAHPQSRFETLSPLRRLLAALLGLAFLVGLIWACAIAYHAQPIEGPTKKSWVTPGAGPRST